MRSWREWRNRIPRLETYAKLIRLNNPRSTYLTPRNMPANKWNDLINLMKSENLKNG